jgi:MerR family transcriptional regulator/heat shock protein HspR
MGRPNFKTEPEIKPEGRSVPGVKERRPDTPVYLISIAADLLGCHPRTLRIYEEHGLLSPSRRHRIRLYSERDIQRGRLIRYLIEERGLNLAGVRLVLEIQEHYHEEMTWVWNGGEPADRVQDDGTTTQGAGERTRGRGGRAK